LPNYATVLSFCAAESKAFRIQPDYRQTVPVREMFRGKTLWQGNVEVFDLTGHPKAKHCYGWTYGEPEEFITILELPPVNSPESAVKVGVAYQIKRARKRGAKL
jgi:hypothetical protein